MKVANNLESYFNIYKACKNAKTPADWLLVALRIASYITVIIPSICGIVYLIVAWHHKKVSSSCEDEDTRFSAVAITRETIKQYWDDLQPELSSSQTYISKEGTNNLKRILLYFQIYVKEGEQDEDVVVDKEIEETEADRREVAGKLLSIFKKEIWKESNHQNKIISSMMIFLDGEIKMGLFKNAITTLQQIQKILPDPYRSALDENLKLYNSILKMLNCLFESGDFNPDDDDVRICQSLIRDMKASIQDMKSSVNKQPSHQFKKVCESLQKNLVTFENKYIV